MRRPPLVPDQLVGRPFRVADAVALGLTYRQLRGSAFRPVLRDVYVCGDVPDSLELRCDALGLTLPPTAAFSHSTAARLYGAAVPEDSGVHVIVPAGTTVPDLRGWVQPHVRLATDDVRVWQGRRLSSPELTWLQLAERLDGDALVIAGDGLLRWTHATVESMSAAVDAAVGRRGVVLAREALPFLRERVDSPRESLLRLVLVHGGLPCPEVGVDLYDDWGQWFARPDLSYRRVKLAMEYEGDHHRERKQFQRDLTRDALYDRNDWTLVKIGDRDLWVPHRPALVRRVERKLNERGWRRGEPYPPW